MGCARDSNACAKVTVGQVGAVAMSAVQIGTMVVTVGASAGATEATSGARASAASIKFAELKKMYEANKEAIKIASKGKDFALAEYKMANAVTDEEIAQAAIELAGVFDPTGLASAAASFTHPTCDKIP